MINSSIKSIKSNGVEILVLGTVQGVGFRPFVYNLASQLKLTGTVANNSQGVVIRLFGDDEGLFSFLDTLENQPPPLAEILSITKKDITEEQDRPSSFTIISSTGSSKASAIIPPDIALCNDCFIELTTPKDPRFNYPFINCTNCGPRFSIVETIPYDRPKTSMKVFPMCKLCSEEYIDPSNRRFHAQPNACPVCGPSVSWHDNQGKFIESDNPFADLIHAINLDKVIGIRGLGGFHLVVNALSSHAIATLRKRKGRPTKPLAVMLPDLDEARRFAEITPAQEELLLSPQHPIVLVKTRPNAELPFNLSPGITDLGIMLPYTPLHHLLFKQENCPKALVMTSGNISGIPICTENQDAINKLGHITDNFLFHNREIVTRVDDSVTRIIMDKPRLIRRSRGYVPSPVVVPWEIPEIIGCGGGMKSTFCLGRGKTAFLSQHIGDLFNLESYEFYQESIEHLKNVFQLQPEIVACDLHPDYMSSRYAEDLGIPLYKIQHHHAHAVTVMAEHGLEEPVLSIILDGTGYGNDGTIWGGEILRTELTSFDRLAHLSHLALPGGDICATEVWRLGLSAIYSAFGKKYCDKNKLPDSLSQIDPAMRRNILTMLENNFNCPKTSSGGRLFDAVAALIGIQNISTYEGQVAMELESLAWSACKGDWKASLLESMRQEKSHFKKNLAGIWEISSAEFVNVIIQSIQNRNTKADIALRFHFMLIERFTRLTRQLSEQTGITKVVLSGGCMQNSLLLEGFYCALTTLDLEVYTASKVPSNDGGISLGQAIIGGLSHVYRTPNESHRG